MKSLRYIDWLLIVSILPLLTFGLFTMKSLAGADYFFNRQLIWIGAGTVVMIIFMSTDWRTFKSSGLILTLYIFGIGLLTLLAIFGYVTRGARSWFWLGSAAFEPVELMKFFLILLFAKYFSTRHIEIALSRHILISFLYLLLPVALVLAHPDLGSAAILFFIWVCLILFSGLTRKQVALLLILAVLGAAIGWYLILQPYQKERILTFIQPERDPRGSGYHAIQAMIAVGSGGIWGKGVGYGTQSRLHFLPESETDFIFAAFAEEWGLVGVAIIFLCFGILFWRIIHITLQAPDNFARFFALGFAFLLLGHIIIHIGMNVGLLPITGIGLPFMSYGGSFFVMLMAGLGLLESIAIRSSLKAYPDEGTLQLIP